MKTVIMYNQGMPVAVPASGVDDALEQKRFRTTSPYQHALVQQNQPKVDLTARGDLGLKINSESVKIKDIVSKLNVPTTVGRKVVENRPYLGIDDLMAKVPGTEWLLKVDLISFVN